MFDGAEQSKTSSLEKRQHTLQEKLNRLQEQLELESRVEEVMRIEKLIADTQENLQAVKAERLILHHQALIAEAGRLKRIGSPHEALPIWNKILSQDPNNQLAANEITTLNKLIEQQTKAAELIKALTSRIKMIRPIFKNVVAALRQTRDTAEYQILLEQTELFIDDILDAETYVLWWEAMYEQSSTQVVQGVDMARIAARVQRGEMVLFLGSAIASSYLGEGAEESNLVKLLARQIGYGQFTGSLSSIAEYYQLRPDFGQAELLKTVRSHLHGHHHEMSLYAVLAQVKSPLILISSNYDNRLEKAFISQNKAFVELTSIVRRSDEYDIGHVVVTYSDHQSTRICSGEELSVYNFWNKVIP
ncbi:MAG: hypothetical protein R3E95_18250 [Thiolinea sp.]